MGTRIYSDAIVEPTLPTAEPERPILKLDGQIDYPLLLIAFVFLVFGLMMVYSASWDFSLLWAVDHDPMSQFKHQLASVGIGIVSAIVFSVIDYHHLKKVALVSMLSLITFLIVLLFLTKTGLTGGRGLFNGSLQPSEFAKIITIIYLAVWMHSKRDQIHAMSLGIIPLGFILSLISSLILLQPDLSATVTVFTLGVLLFFLGGGDIKQMIGLVVIVAVVGFAVIRVSSYDSHRWAEFTQGLVNISQASYHELYAYESIIRGGWFGVGIGAASTKLIGLPFAPTDSIFAVIVEELGFAGAAFTVLLFSLFVWRGLRIASRAPDMLGSLLAAGLTFWIGAEALINILVMVGLLPFAGNALPFISYGGSNMVCALTAIGILMSIARQGQAQQKTQEWSDKSESVDLRGRDRRRSVSSLGGS